MASKKDKKDTADKKDTSVVAVLSGLTGDEAADISADFMKLKNKRAPDARGTIATGKTKNIGKFLSSEVPKIEQNEE